MNCSLDSLLFGIFASCPFAIYGPDPEVIFFSYTTQLNTKFILLINVKMPTLGESTMYNMSRKTQI